jgi:serine/threonine protein kinase
VRQSAIDNPPLILLTFIVSPQKLNMMSRPNIAFETVVTLCLHSPQSTCLWDVPGGNRVIRIPNSNLVVKFGRGVTQAEAQTQEEVSKIIDSSIIHVPQVHSFYHDGDQNIGYLIMEFVEGEPIDVGCTEQVEGLQKTLDHLSSLKRAFPGTLHSGELQGILWEDDAPSTHNTSEGLADWINKWQDDKVILDGEDFVLCHLDTALQNMLWLPSGKICLLDWGSAGYYPRYFELAAHQKKGRPDEIIENMLMSPRKPFSYTEVRHKNALIRACSRAMRSAKPGRPPALEPAPPRQYLIKQPSIPNEFPVEAPVKI